MSPNDPTNDVLAAIASIFVKSDAPAVAEHADDVAPAEPAGVEKPAEEIEGYSRSGPGPLDAIRFKWTARRDDSGDYFVDETIGDQSRPITSGPLPEDQVIAFVDAREQEARERFDRLKDDMTVRPPETVAAEAEVERAHVEHDATSEQGF